MKQKPKNRIGFQLQRRAPNALPIYHIWLNKFKVKLVRIQINRNIGANTRGMKENVDNLHGMESMMWCDLYGDPLWPNHWMRSVALALPTQLA